MRFDTNAMRIRYGVPIFVTFSPDEAHNLLMIRLSRTRRNDPVFAEGSDPVGKRYCGRDAPHLGDLSDVTAQNSMDTDVSGRRDVINRPPCPNTSKSTSVHEQDADVIMDVPIKDIMESLPSYDERRRLLARDSLASVDGFKMLLMVTYEYLFGMRVCFFCPDCNALSKTNNVSPCQDLFGSNAHAEGGIFGRIDAGFTSIEAQKSTACSGSNAFINIRRSQTFSSKLEILLKIL